MDTDLRLAILSNEFHCRSEALRLRQPGIRQPVPVANLYDPAWQDKQSWVQTTTGLLSRDDLRGFLAGANLGSGQPDVLLSLMARFFQFLPGEQRQAFVNQVTEKAS